MKNVFSQKGTTEVEVFSLDWTNPVQNDIITSSQWSVVSGGVSIVTNSIEEKRTLVKLSGGSVGWAKVINTVTTAAGQTLVEECFFEIVDKSVL